MRRQHAPAAGDSFFLCLIGYWSQSILGGGYALAKAQMQRGFGGMITIVLKGGLEPARKFLERCEIFALPRAWAASRA